MFPVILEKPFAENSITSVMLVHPLRPMHLPPTDGCVGQCTLRSRDCQGQG